MINLLFFGSLSDIATDIPQQLDYSSELSSPASIREYLRTINSTFTAALDDDAILVAIDGQIADWNTIVSNGSEIAFMPPMTGG